MKAIGLLIVLLFSLSCAGRGCGGFGDTSAPGLPKKVGADLAQARPATCEDKSLDGNESDIDCGGGCAPCAFGKRCNQHSDCEQANCANHACARAPCLNDVQDDGETDIDCGGPICVKCHEGKRCGSNDDCDNGNCVERICQLPSACADGVQNGDETDVDCGGRGCPPCGSGRKCLGPGDCASSNCSDYQCGAAVL